MKYWFQMKIQKVGLEQIIQVEMKPTLFFHPTLMIENKSKILKGDSDFVDTVIMLTRLFFRRYNIFDLQMPASGSLGRFDLFSKQINCHHDNWPPTFVTDANRWCYQRSRFNTCSVVWRLQKIQKKNSQLFVYYVFFFFCQQT